MIPAPFRPVVALMLATSVLLAAAPVRAAREGFGRGGGGVAAHGMLPRSRGRGEVRPGFAGRRFESEFGYGFPYGPYGGPYDDAGPWLPPLPDGGAGPYGIPAATAPAPVGPPAQACVPATAPGMPNVIYPSADGPPTCG